MSYLLSAPDHEDAALDLDGAVEILDRECESMSRSSRSPIGDFASDRFLQRALADNSI
jgi:hypothetical protein